MTCSFAEAKRSSRITASFSAARRARASSTAGGLNESNGCLTIYFKAASQGHARLDDAEATSRRLQLPPHAASSAPNKSRSRIIALTMGSSIAASFLCSNSRSGWPATGPACRAASSRAAKHFAAREIVSFPQFHRFLPELRRGRPLPRAGGSSTTGFMKPDRAWSSRESIHCRLERIVG